MPDEKALDKIDIGQELKILSPIEAKSIELKKQAEEVEITDKETYGKAKKIRKELVSHRTSTKDLRLTFTRKLDNLKDQFIKKQDAVLEPSLAGEAVVKEKIAEWEKAEQERKDAEEKRIKEITDKFALMQINSVDRKTGTLEDVKRARAAIKMELGLLEPNDRTRVAVKKAVEDTRAWLDETEQFITDRIEQERIADEQRIERERLDKERKELEKEREVTAQKAKEVDDSAAGLAGAPDVTTLSNDGSTGLTESSVKRIKNIVDKTDGLVLNMLKTYGFTVDPLNIEESRNELQAAGYELIRETVSTGMEESIHKYKLMRLVDQVEVKVKIGFDLGE